jgi:pimeloyl-ACP methyl ester carboxylesterase
VGIATRVRHQRDATRKSRTNHWSMKLTQMRLFGGLTALMLASAGYSAGPVFAAGPANLDEFYQQKPAWSPCDFDTSVDCASISVPLNYAKPSERRISIAISRQPASDPAKRRGVLVSNPGGPGGSGLADRGSDGKERSWPKSRFASTPLSTYYDLIGFDPRGVGRSTLLSCEDATEERPLNSRPTAADFEQQITWAKASEAGCQQVSGDLRPHISTRNTARDMDVIRGVLGQKKISYVGYSYGTYLGAVYGTMFPDRLDRSVLDSAVSGDMNWRTTDMSSAIAAKRNVEKWSAWVAQRDTTFHLGTSTAAVLRTVEATSARLASTPSDGLIQQMMFDQEMGFTSDLRGQWATLAELVRQTRDTGAFAPPLPPEQASSTSLVSGYLPVNQTIHCETDWPTDLNIYRQDTARFSKQYPYGSGASDAMPQPCTFRGFTPAEKPTSLHRKGYPVGLVVQAEGDIQTAYDGGVVMAKRLGNRLITVADDGNHGQYARRGNTCVDTAVTSYLLDGALPPAGLTCPGQPRPTIPADAPGAKR